MLTKNERIPWILSLKTRRFRLVVEGCIALSTICLAIGYGFATAFLVVSLCIVGYHLPVVVAYFNDIHFGHVSVSNQWNTSYQQPQTLSHEPYYLIEGQLVSSQVNEALEKLFNSILKNYVLLWQTKFEVKEDQFILELRHITKFFLIQFHQRLSAVDLPNLVIHEIVPLFLWHVHCYSVGTELSPETEKYVLSCLGNHLHPAIQTRKTEETYLRNVSQKLVKILLPPQLTSCKLFTILMRDILSNLVLQKTLDTISDPDIINQLLMIGLKINDEGYLHSTTDEVTLFNNFTDFPVQAPTSYLYPKLSEVLKTPSYLYHLMQFMKREKSLKYLQFIFAVDEFNEKLLNPDLSVDQMQKLQIMGKMMFEMYFTKRSTDSIGFSNDSVDQMELIVFGETKDIVRLRTSPTLFQAYEHVIEVMETSIIPRFYRSSEFYKHWLGSQNPETTPKNQKRKTGGTSSGWLKKLRTTITPNWLSADAKLAITEEEFLIDDTGVDLTEASVIPDDDMEPDEEPSYVEIPAMARNLSSWRTSIPKVVSAVDSSGRPGWAFEVEIQRLDLRPGDDPEDFHWTVARTYNEFYVLETKLKEFHGDLPVRLPPKKMFGTREFAFLQSVRLEFEAYLKMLLTQPALKGSDLVFSFLTLSDLSSCHAISDNSLNLLPNIGLGRMLRNVPLKLRKERGQDLDNFVQTLIASTITPKPKPSKLEAKETSSTEVSVPVIKQLHPLYRDNVKSFLPNEENSQRLLPRGIRRFQMDGAYDCLLFLVIEVWRLPQFVVGVLLGLQSWIAVYFNSFIYKYVSHKFFRALHPSNVTAGINLLHETMFEDTSRESESSLENRRTAWNMVKASVHPWLEKILGHEVTENRLKLMFQCLQYPILNKQLSYMSLDVLMKAIFPEVFEDVDEKSNSQSPNADELST